jgi:predicted ATP-dependent endonuclease of OLD family
MAKIQRITVNNIKSIENQTLNLKGCTALIVAGNRKGKTTLLRSLFDRLQGVKADEPLRQGAERGFSEFILTTGEKIRWDINSEGKEKLTYTTEKEIKIPMTVELRKKFAPELFDLDHFLSEGPKKQVEILQKISGVNFTEIDKSYKSTYDERTFVNKKLAEAEMELNKMEVPDKILKADLTPLQDAYNLSVRNFQAINEEIRNYNSSLKDDYQKKIEDHNSNMMNFMKLQSEKVNAINFYKGILSDLHIVLNKLPEQPRALVDLNRLRDFIDGLDKPEDFEEPKPVMPELKVEFTDDIESLKILQDIKKLEEQNKKADLFEQYEMKRKAIEVLFNESALLTKKLNGLEDEKKKMIAASSLPAGFSFDDEGILFNNFRFTKEQLSQSEIYIAALKLAATQIGEIRSLHFDASLLDKNSLRDIEDWAKTEDLQLLIERPDFDGGEITYELVDCTETIE